MSDKSLDAAMDNALASHLGEIARDAGRSSRTDVGDTIDRGLILVRLLKERGFVVYYRTGATR